MENIKNLFLSGAKKNDIEKLILNKEKINKKPTKKKRGLKRFKI